MMTSRCARLLASLLLLAFAWSVAPCFAADEETQPPDKQPSKRRWAIKPSVALFWPSDSKTRDRFSGSWPSIGLTVDLRNTNRDKNRMEFRAEGLYRRVGDDHALMVPLGISVKHRFLTKEWHSPYAGVAAYVVPVDIESREDAVDTGLTLTGGGCVFVGSDLGHNFKLEASYLMIAPVSGFDLSGLKLQLSAMF